MSKAITVRVDEATKRQAEILLDEIGLNMTVYFNASLKALLREKKVPFELSAKKETNEEYWARIDEAWQNYEDGNFIAFTPEEFEVFTKLSPEEAKDLVEKQMGVLT